MNNLKKIAFPLVLISFFSLSSALFSCTKEKPAPLSEDEQAQLALVETINSGAALPMAEVKAVKEGGYEKTYNVADIDDCAAEYITDVKPGDCFFVVSKQEFRLYVYRSADSALVAHYPVCYAKNTGDKTREGDCCTPNSAPERPFTISQICDAQSWTHDFGWGPIAAYGQYFMRLDIASSQVPQNRSIGIHGSTGNEQSVPGRDSEGCIRLRDNDLIRLHDLYAAVGTEVTVKPFNQGKLPFEKRAEEALGTEYRHPAPGNPLVKTDVATTGNL